jgi:hypothetical protein
MVVKKLNQAEQAQGLLGDRENAGIFPPENAPLPGNN